MILPTNDYPPARGGVARYLQAVKKTFPQNVEILHWQKLPGRFRMFFQLWKELKKFDSLWTSHILPIGTMAMIVASLLRKPYGVFLHGLDFDLARRNAWKRFLTKKILRKAQFVVANSNALRKEIENFCDRSVEVIYPTVNDALVESASMLFKDKKYCHKKKIHLLTTGRLIERKGHINVLEAIVNKPEFYYTIIGDGAFRSVIEEKIKALGLGDRVEILRNVKDAKLAHFYALADIFVMPVENMKGDREGFGIVYLEAQLFGLPVIATDLPGVNEAIKGGILINGKSELPKALNKLANDCLLRKKLGRIGRDFILDNFTREKQFKKLEKFL